VLSLYRRLIALRATSQALQVGTLRLDPDTTDDLAPTPGSRRAGRRRGLQPRSERGLVAAPGRLTGGAAGEQPAPFAQGHRFALTGGVALDLAPDEARVFERIG
jgi:hypothetical protein